MKNWFKYSNLQKTATLSLSVSGLLSQRNLTDISELAFEFQARIGAMPALNNHFIADVISADGFPEIGESTGKINFYLDAKSKPQDIEDLKARIIQVAKELNLEGTLGEVENWQSKIQEEREFLRQLQNDPQASHEDIENRSIRIADLPNESAPRVIRFNVLKNKNKRHVYPPAINMANNNAFYIFNTILQYNKDFWDDSSFNAEELKRRCQYFLGEAKFENKNLEELKGKRKNIQDAFNSGEGQDLTNEVDFLNGKLALSDYDDEDVREKLEKIIRLCDWAINNGYKTLEMA